VLPPSSKVPPPARALSSELAKAHVIDTSTGASYPVMYNPEELKFEQGNTFAEVGVPGLNAPPLQYVRGKARVLTMELFFDSYEVGADVRDYTGPIVGLLDRQPLTKAPPVLLFSLGRLQFRCVLVDAGQRFTMFLRDGTPVRSTMSVRLQEYVDIEVDITQGLFFGSPTASAIVNAAAAPVVAGLTAAGASTVHVVTQTDTLSGIAAAYLGDASQWRVIANANKITDPLDLVPGTSLVIPPPAAGSPGPRS
jgi:nucleoid-associated protein YgaU